MVLNQRHRGLSSDVAWGLFHCIQNGLKMPSRAARAIAETEDNCIALLALHMKKANLLPSTFTAKALSAASSAGDVDGRNWLFMYEAHRAGFMKMSAVASHPLFG